MQFIAKFLKSFATISKKQGFAMKYYIMHGFAMSWKILQHNARFCNPL